MRAEVEKILNEEVKPMLAMHGGGVELVDVTEDGTVKVKLTGGCASCLSAQATLKGIIANTIQSKVPQVKKVEAV